MVSMKVKTLSITLGGNVRKNQFSVVSSFQGDARTSKCNKCPLCSKDNTSTSYQITSNQQEILKYNQDEDSIRTMEKY